MSESANNLADKFFRRQHAQLVAYLSKLLGPSHLDIAEDMVQETLIEAMHQWEFKGIPENPEAWLFTVARNKTLNHLKIESNRKRLLHNQPIALYESHEVNMDDFEDQLLTMMFICCHPAISAQAQITLILKTLCGLSITEISEAFLSSTDTINKRLVRARKKLREVQIRFELPPTDELDNRLHNVLKSLLLLFNEGYSSSVSDMMIREELCLESIRLAEMLAADERFLHSSDVHCLLALMYFQISRFHSRVDEDGVLVTIDRQDRNLWNKDQITQGLQHLSHIGKSRRVSFYQISATIAAHHSTANHFSDTNWKGILELYDLLIKIDSSAPIQINRAVALAQVHGHHQGIQLLKTLQTKLIEDYQHYYTTLGEFQWPLYCRKKVFTEKIKYDLKKLIECCPF